jgi:hypothetical protein
MLAVCRASDRGYRRGLGVARLGGARCWLRPGDRCRASVRRSVAAHHNDRRWSDRIMRAGRKKDAAHHQYAKRPEASWSTFRHWTLVDRAPRRGSRTESYGSPCGTPREQLHGKGVAGAGAFIGPETGLDKRPNRCAAKSLLAFASGPDTCRSMSAPHPACDTDSAGVNDATTLFRFRA